MNTNVYKFSYGGSVRKILSKFISLMYNFLLGIFTLIIFAFIMSEINYIFKDFLSDMILDVLKQIEVYLGIVVLVLFIISTFLPQKVEVRAGTIKIHRHCLFLSVFMIFRGFNDTIPIRSIKEIYIARSKDKFFEPIPVNVIDWENMVIIETESRYYYAPVHNAEKFINDVNQRRAMLTEKSTADNSDSF